MQIYLTLLDGTIHTIDIDENTTFIDIKKEIGFDIMKQQLIFYHSKTSKRIIANYLFDEKKLSEFWCDTMCLNTNYIYSICDNILSNNLHSISIYPKKLSDDILTMFNFKYIYNSFSPIKLDIHYYTITLNKQ